MNTAEFYLTNKTKILDKQKILCYTKLLQLWKNHKQWEKYHGKRKYFWNESWKKKENVLVPCSLSPKLQEVD